LPFIATVATVRERPEFQKPPDKFDWRQGFIEPFGMRTFVFALLMYLLAFTAMDTVSSIVVYYMKYYLERGGEAQYVSGTLLVSQVAALAFYVWLSKRTSKRTGYIVGTLIWIGAMLVSFLITPTSPNFVIYVFAVVVGLGTGGIVIMIYAIFPDIPDVDELQSRQRREGMYSALVTFMRKFSAAIAIFLVSQAIDASGYVAPIEEVVNGDTRLIEQPQSAEFILVLRIVFAIVPIALLLIAMLFAWRYPLTGEVHERLKRVLAMRRSGEKDDAAIQQEAAELQNILIGK
jgi:oligogalacturonide transporter